MGTVGGGPVSADRAEHFTGGDVACGKQAFSMDGAFGYVDFFGFAHDRFSQSRGGVQGAVTHRPDPLLHQFRLHPHHTARNRG